MYVAGLIFMWVSGLVCGVVLAIGLARAAQRDAAEQIDEHARVVWPVDATMRTTRWCGRGEPISNDAASWRSRMNHL